MLDVELPGDDADAMTAEYDVFAQGAQGAEGDELLERARLALDGGIVWIFDIFALAIEHFDDEPVTQAPTLPESTSPRSYAYAPPPSVPAVPPRFGMRSIGTQPWSSKLSPPSAP